MDSSCELQDGLAEFERAKPALRFFGVRRSHLNGQAQQYRHCSSIIISVPRKWMTIDLWHLQSFQTSEPSSCHLLESTATTIRAACRLLKPGWAVLLIKFLFHSIRAAGRISKDLFRLKNRFGVTPATPLCGPYH